MDNTKELYKERLDYLDSIELIKVISQIKAFLEVFPHNTMDIPKAKPNAAAYKASEVVWESYAPVLEACNAVENTLYLALNSVFVETLPKEVAQLQRASEALLEAYRGIKGNQDLNEYAKNTPKCLQKPKELAKVFVLSTEYIGKDLGILFDRELLFLGYKESYEEIIAKENK